MTPSDLKESPLKKGDFLHHPALGIVAYRRKIRGNPHEIEVTHVHLAGGKQVHLRVKLSDVTRQKKAGTMKGSYLFVAVCPHCDLRIRVSRKWLDTGTPRCFNGECPSLDTVQKRQFGAGAKLEVQTGEHGEARLGQAMEWNPPQFRDNDSPAFPGERGPAWIDHPND